MSQDKKALVAPNKIDKGETKGKCDAKEKGGALCIPLVGSSLSGGLKQWIAKCPDPTAMKAAIEELIWLNENVPCYECQEHTPRKDLRNDTGGPWAAGKLICQECWTYYNELETSTHQDWPADRLPKKGVVVAPETFDGVLVHKVTRAKVGTAKGYNPKTRMARLVTLLAFPDAAEAGLVDPGHDVENLLPSSSPFPAADDE